MSKIKLSKNFIKSACKLALNEDLYPSGDITSELIKKDKIINVKLISNQNAVIGGLLFIKQAFAEAMDLQKNGRLSEAKEIYLKILVQSPNDANALHLISLVFMAEGNYNEAKSYIEKAINEAPNQAVFHSNYGGLLHTMGDLPASVKALKKSLKLDKKLFQSYYSLGIVYTDMEELEKAVEFYTKALEIDPSSTAAHKTLPFGTDLRVCYETCETVTVTDRGPFIKGRDLDLSYGTAKRIGMAAAGVGDVEVTRLN